MTSLFEEGSRRRRSFLPAVTGVSWRCKHNSMSRASSNTFHSRLLAGGGQQATRWRRVCPTAPVNSTSTCAMRVLIPRAQRASGFEDPECPSLSIFPFPFHYLPVCLSVGRLVWCVCLSVCRSDLLSDCLSLPVAQVRNLNEKNPVTLVLLQPDRPFDGSKQLALTKEGDQRHTCSGKAGDIQEFVSDRNAGDNVCIASSVS